MQNDSCKILLPDGRNVDLCTPQGANNFLKTPNPGKYISNVIEDANKIRTKSRKKKNSTNNGDKLNSSDKQLLTYTYFLIDSLAQNGSQDLFASNIQNDVLELWLDHTMNELVVRSKDTKWHTTGNLAKHDNFLLVHCIPMFMHKAPTELAFEKGFFRVLAEFIASRKDPLLPCEDIADSVCLLCGNAFISIAYDGLVFNSEKVIKKFESSGMLAQFIRCSTISQHCDSACVVKFYEELMLSSALIQKKFKKGEPCGDVVYSILNGRSGVGGGYKKKNSVIQKLEYISFTVNNMQKNVIEGEHEEFAGKMCRTCSTADSSLQMLVCSRCQKAYYCSKECQKVDWKRHKAKCVPSNNEELKRAKADEETVLNFVQRYYVEIMMKIIDTCDKSATTGLNKSDLILEFDFMPDDSGTCPVLRDPPEFKVAEVRGYLEGSRPNLPNWCDVHGDRQTYDEKKNSIVRDIKDLRSRITDDHVMCLARFPTTHSIYRLQCKERNGSQIFSFEAVDAFQSAIQDDDFEPLKRMFEASRVEWIKEKLGKSSLPHVSDLDMIRIMLNRMGADFPLTGNNVD